MSNQLRFVAAKEFKKSLRDLEEGEAVSPSIGIRKHYVSQIKVPDDEESRILDFIISTSSVDRDNDTVNPKGWQLKNFEANPVVLFAHDSGRPPIGRALKVTSDGDALRAKAEFMGDDIDTTGFSESIFRMLKGGFLKATSVGFVPKEFTFAEEKDGNENRAGGIDFQKQELLEFSIVPVPSNPDALLEARGKGINMEPLAEWYEEALDEWTNHKDLLLVPRKTIEDLYKSSKPTKNLYHMSKTTQEQLLEDNLKRVKEQSNEAVEQTKNQLVNVAARIFDQPLLLHPQKFKAIMQVMGPRLGIDKDFIKSHCHAGKMFQKKTPKLEYKVENGIAVIPVTGTLVHDHAYLDSYSGMTSYNVIEDKFLKALNDPSVKGIALHIDSGGGECSGCFDLVDTIYEARGQKPIWSIVNDMAFSAAYAIATAADQIVISRTGGVGSVGVVMVHQDQSRALDNAGLTFTIVQAGDRKTDGNPFEPLSDEALETYETEVARMYDLFAATVSRNLGMDEDLVRETEAQCYFGAEAEKVGFAGKILNPTTAFKNFSIMVNTPVTPMETKEDDVEPQVDDDVEPQVDDDVEPQVDDDVEPQVDDDLDLNADADRTLRIVSNGLPSETYVTVGEHKLEGVKSVGFYLDTKGCPHVELTLNKAEIDADIPEGYTITTKEDVIASNDEQVDETLAKDEVDPVEVKDQEEEFFILNEDDVRQDEEEEAEEAKINSNEDEDAEAELSEENIELLISELLPEVVEEVMNEVLAEKLNKLTGKVK